MRVWSPPGVSETERKEEEGLPGERRRASHSLQPPPPRDHCAWTGERPPATNRNSPTGEGGAWDSQ